MIITTVPADIAEAILEGLTPFFNRHKGVVFSTDIQVSRVAKLQPPG